MQNQQTEPKEQPNCQWSATHDFMPPEPACLRVQGTCDMPTPGYKLSLSRAVPQGFNPQILLLRLETHAPTDIVPQVITPTEVEYREETDFDYTHVTILPAGATVEVENVH